MVVLPHFNNAQIGFVQASFELGVHGQRGPVVFQGGQKQFVVRMTAVRDRLNAF